MTLTVNGIPIYEYAAKARMAHREPKPGYPCTCMQCQPRGYALSDDAE